MQACFAFALDAVVSAFDMPHVRRAAGQSSRRVSFTHYDLGYIDLEQKTLQPLDNPFGPRLSPMS